MFTRILETDRWLARYWERKLIPDETGAGAHANLHP
jgi:hypothetical protein